MFLTRKSFAVIAIVGVLGFAGCGGDDDDEPTTISGTPVGGPTGATGAEGASEVGPLPAEVVGEGNQICADAQEELYQAYDELGTKDLDDAFVEDVVVPNLRGQIDDLRQLDDSKELQTVLDDAEDNVADIESAQTFVKGGPYAPVKFNDLGLNECASIGSSAPY